MTNLASVAVYFTAAQTAFSSGDYTEARKQLVLAEMELNKLPSTESDQGTSVTLRAGIKDLREEIRHFEKEGNRGSRRSYMREV